MKATDASRYTTTEYERIIREIRSRVLYSCMSWIIIQYNGETSPICYSNRRDDKIESGEGGHSGEGTGGIICLLRSFSFFIGLGVRAGTLSAVFVTKYSYVRQLIFFRSPHQIFGSRRHYFLARRHEQDYLGDKRLSFHLYLK